MCRPLKHTSATNPAESRTSPRSYRTESRASPRSHRLVLYERNNDRFIRDLDHVVALLTAGMTRARGLRGTRARSTARARASGSREGHNASSHAAETHDFARKPSNVNINTSGSVTLFTNDSTTSSVTAGQDGHGSYASWDIEVRTSFFLYALQYNATTAFLPQLS